MDKIHIEVGETEEDGVNSMSSESLCVLLSLYITLISTGFILVEMYTIEVYRRGGYLVWRKLSANRTLRLLLYMG